MRPCPPRDRDDACVSETPRVRLLPPPKSRPPLPPLPAMAIRLPAHAFAGNPLRSLRDAAPEHSPAAALESLSSHLLSGAGAEATSHRVLAFRKGRPLVRSSSPSSPSSAPPRWSLGFASPAEFKGFSPESFVYLGSGLDGESGATYWAVDVSAGAGADADAARFGLGRTGGGDGLCFVELRTLMVAADWNDSGVMGELAIAGHARAILEWHGTSRFCGSCGSTTACIDAGRRKQCTNESCKKRFYPRVDPVVIMLVIDKENDRALLSRQSRFVPRMWSCLAGFIEPGESLEEAVKRETWEETGIEVGEVIYHSSQPWPVGPSSMPCQLMVGFFAYAKSLDIRVDKKELEDAQWHSREDVKNALTFAEYEKAQRTSAVKVNQMCKGVEKGPNFPSDFDVESGELAPMFIPGPFAIAHHLISSWIHGDATNGPESPLRQLNSLSSL